jgi:hypothetical protein
MAQYSNLIRFWLRQDPAEGLDNFISQAASALWVEERCFKSLGVVIGQVFGKK